MIGQAINQGSPVNRSHPLCRDLTAWWKVLGQGKFWAGNTLHDLTGSHPGTLTNAPTWQGATGRPGGMGCLRCADTQHVVVSSLANMVGGNAQVTMALWIKPNGITSSECMIDCGGFDILWSMTGAPFNRLVLTIRQEGVGSLPGFLESGDNAVTADVWQQVMFVVDGTNDAHALYVNGVSVKTASTAFTTFATDGDNYFFISDSASNALGDYDDVMLWLGRALSAAEASALYRNSIRPDNPMLNWIRRPVLVNSPAAPAGNRRRRVLMGAA